MTIQRAASALQDLKVMESASVKVLNALVFMHSPYFLKHVGNGSAFVELESF